MDSVMHPAEPSDFDEAPSQTPVAPRQAAQAPTRPFLSRFRFSLLGLLTFIFIVALSISYWQTRTRLRETEAALTTLRNEVGELTISDAKDIHVIAIPSFEGMTYRWRVYLPKDREFHLKMSHGQIPESGLPTPAQARVTTREFSDTAYLEPFVLTVAVNKDHLGNWRTVVDDGSANIGIFMPDDETGWLEKRSGHTWRVAGRDETEAFHPDEPLFLLRLRKTKPVPGSPGASTVDMDPTDGILVWIEEK